jgi:hypothetical protein
MNIITVNSITKTLFEGIYNFEILVDMGTHQEVIPYTYNPADTADFKKVVDAWWAANPNFAINEYVEPVLPSIRIGEFRDFMKLFTPAEQVAIVTATQSNAPLKLWYDTAMGGPEFSLDHPDTTAGLTELVNASLLTQARMDEILNDGDFRNV